jgi:hypothetical protein
LPWEGGVTEVPPAAVGGVFPTRGAIGAVVEPPRVDGVTVRLVEDRGGAKGVRGEFRGRGLLKIFRSLWGTPVERSPLERETPMPPNVLP